MRQRAPSSPAGGAAALALLLLSCSPATTPTAAPVRESAAQIVDTGVILTAAQAAEGVPALGPFWTPDVAHVQAAEARLRELLSMMSNERAHRVSMTLPSYRRQYFGYFVDGRRFLYINASAPAP